jgi:hypothetical protein
MTARARRLADFQHGRAPELAELAESRAAQARAAMLTRKRAAAAERAAALEAEAVQAHTDAMVAEVIRLLAEAAGWPAARRAALWRAPTTGRSLSRP